jgi:hypothetical protein
MVMMYDAGHKCVVTVTRTSRALMRTHENLSRYRTRPVFWSARRSSDREPLSLGSLPQDTDTTDE